MYHASAHPEETDLEDQFDDALEAMWYVEYDGEPVPIDGVDGLYVGSVGESYRTCDILSGVGWFLACLLTYPWFNYTHLYLPGALPIIFQPCKKPVLHTS